MIATSVPFEILLPCSLGDEKVVHDRMRRYVGDDDPYGGEVEEEKEKRKVGQHSLI